MTCLEAQTKIMAFIDNKLNDEELYAFVKHVKNCNNCAEELEIYYTMLVGMKQLDNNENLSADFKKELNTKLDNALNRINNTKRLKSSTLFVASLLVVGFIIVGYNNFLSLVYQQEQKIKLSRQTEYYYYDTFGAAILNEHRIQIRDFNVVVEQVPKDETKDFYEKIHQYNINQLLLEQEEPNE